MKYRIFISIVDISANLENIDIDINNAILKISISISILIRLFWKILISIGLFWNISISISILIRTFWKISISISKRRFLENIDIDKISNRLESGISNRAKEHPFFHKCPFSTSVFISAIPGVLLLKSHCRETTLSALKVSETRP